MLKIKIIVIGEGGVGKTSLVQKYCNNTFDEKYVPTIVNIIKSVHENADRILKLTS